MSDSYLQGAPKECIGTNGFGTDYAEFNCVHTTLAKFILPVLSFEQFYDPVDVLTWMRERPLLPVCACIFYAVSIIAGRRYMANKPAFSWRKTLAVWNFSLSLFSWIGAFRTAPKLLYHFASYSLRNFICDDPSGIYGSGSTGLWTQLFVLSKFPELLDTFFIIIHKKPLLFLHWYHHITVLLYCWFSYVAISPVGYIFTVMNYTVHAVMYGYYFLTAIKMRPKWFNPIVVTFMQLSQMFIGVGVTALAYYYYINPIEGQTCYIEKKYNIAAFGMYGSYFCLFAHFFFARYIKVRVEKDVSKKSS